LRKKSHGLLLLWDGRRCTETVFTSTTEGSTLSDTALKAFWSPSATARDSGGITIDGAGVDDNPDGKPCAWARFPFLGVVHEKERKARENPKIIPISTRLKTKKFLDDSLRIKFIFISFKNI